MEATRLPGNLSQQHLMSTPEEHENPLTGSVKPSPPVERVVTLREWLTVLVLCYVNLINYMDRFTIAGILPILQKDFNKGDTAMGLLSTAFVVSYMIFAPLFGYLGDRYNRTIIMSSGVFLWCLTTLVGSFTTSYEGFIVSRIFVGIGEASYSTIAPTIISDLFVKDVRSKMLALFYFAIPVGSGLGYITGSEVEKATNSWQWGLRVTPVLGALAVFLLLYVVRDPIRGEREGGAHIHSTTWFDDIKSLCKNPSFMLSSAGFTCISFVTGALAWWGPKFVIEGQELIPHTGDIDQSQVSFTFGLITMVAGIIGVPLGSIMAQRLRVKYAQADPLICAVGLLFSAPLLFFASVTANTNSAVCYTLIFFGQLTMNLNWAIVADMLLYVVIPTRRSTAEAFQIAMAHALGDAGSPFLIGGISDLLQRVLGDDKNFFSLQYALFVTTFVEVLGALFFFMTAIYIQRDKAIVDLSVAGETDSETSQICADELPNNTTNSVDGL